jgi:hypothetical protein
MKLTEADRFKFATLRNKIVKSAVFLFSAPGSYCAAYKSMEDVTDIINHPDWKRLAATHQAVKDTCEIYINNSKVEQILEDEKIQVAQMLHNLKAQDENFRKLCESSLLMHVINETSSKTRSKPAADGSSHPIAKPAPQLARTPRSTARHEGSASVPQTTDNSQSPPTHAAPITSSDSHEARWKRKLQEYQTKEKQMMREHDEDKTRMEREIEKYKIRQLQFEIAKGEIKIVKGRIEVAKGMIEIARGENATEVKKLELQRLVSEHEARFELPRTRSASSTPARGQWDWLVGDWCSPGLLIAQSLRWRATCFMVEP